MNAILKLEISIIRACKIKRVRADLYGSPCTYNNNTNPNNSNIPNNPCPNTL